MKKKILLIAVLFMVTLLTGCGSKEKVVIYTSMEEERNQKLSEMVKKEFPEDKIGYFSDARMVALYDEKVHGGFRSGNDCRSKGKNEDG